MKLGQYEVTTFRKNNNHIMMFEHSDQTTFAISFTAHQAFDILRELISASLLRDRIDQVDWHNNDINYNLSICITDKKQKRFGLSITATNKDCNDTTCAIFFDYDHLQNLIKLFGTTTKETY